MMFGNSFQNDDTIIRPLESQQIRRLYPQHFDRKKELKKLNHSLLVNFLDLIDILIYAPESQRRTEKIDDLTLVSNNVLMLKNCICYVLLIIIAFCSHSSFAKWKSTSSGTRDSKGDDGITEATKNWNS